ncbi:uncharacterized protein UV8b_07693 [Ustilaginoidea virens]|uniref:Zn(2)-C6 fungal-type domain-containing protein n=1 Tax=Ustilaginoidea virens TaxID=1159556 RepID=A0A8E5ML89_USTVR|nr:uncharacterized protein UV8b_07693 [Ustilaginoidea virens]QUC23452.1 hypothetical protein UV8b_07693 [Ustilaginoidea virens]
MISSHVQGTGVGTPSATRKYMRSRSGCLTCKQRKVKCNEQHPKCSHCERLNMECIWAFPRRAPVPSTSPSADQLLRLQQFATPDDSLPLAWSETLDPSFLPADGFDSMPLMRNLPWSEYNDDLSRGPLGDSLDYAISERPNRPTEEVAGGGDSSVCSPQPHWTSRPKNKSSELDDGEFIRFFVDSLTLPLLEDVEARQKWSTVRHDVVGMARMSSMVRNAICAFSALLMARKGNVHVEDGIFYYQKASSALTSLAEPASLSYSHHREHALVVLFFLCYIDILETRMEAAHAHLKRAFNVFQGADKTTFSCTEKQFLLWIRLLDARAVSAGGEGLFLIDDNEAILTENSPACHGCNTDSPETHLDVVEDAVEDVLFQTLYHPGLVFFQKVQSFSGRISKIDPWHRSRGTVEDEIEVVNIGASIAAGLRSLYDHRPLLMDLAIAGKVTEPHLSRALSGSITRTYRTYLSNFYACRVHLHRVAYKSLPLTKEAEDALAHIRTMAHWIVDELDPSENLPVTMLWPLLMLGAEEGDEGERLWIKEQILRMEKVAGNARLTTKVLEEVQARQDAAKQRIDIRSVMHSVHNSCFAIV